ncbi:translation elongation factor Ts [Candidatus Peregrinibacteria bacterium]|nr:translation elongation factor Ts [bacterium]NCQ55964.1 translation elongation factor Ts [Candidatus Parcubacteria bacterium]NCS67989.1 translation elongation factor Ts [Candidatus Peregrinibacteria bacterium]
MAITAQMVKELRDRTGVAMMACKKALEEANGDMDEAIAVLRKRGAAKAADKADRSTSEGAIAISGRSMVKLLCETDFVGKNEKFVQLASDLAAKAESEGVEAAKAHFEDVKTDKIQEIGENIVLDEIVQIDGGDTVSGYVHSNGKIGVLVSLEGGSEDHAKDVAMHAAAMDPLVATPDDVSDDLIAKEMEIAKAQLIEEGKPANIIDNILAGKAKKFCAERALTSQSFVKDPSQTVQEYLGDAQLIAFVRVAI